MTPGVDYCYNNVFADINLNGGEPELESPYYVVDWFTWSGWLEAYLFHYWVSMTKEFLMYFVIVAAFATFYLTSGIKFCVAGDITIFG